MTRWISSALCTMTLVAVLFCLPVWNIRSAAAVSHVSNTAMSEVHIVKRVPKKAPPAVQKTAQPKQGPTIPASSAEPVPVPEPEPAEVPDEPTEIPPEETPDDTSASAKASQTIPLLLPALKIHFPIRRMRKRLQHINLMRLGVSLQKKRIRIPHVQTVLKEEYAYALSSIPTVHLPKRTFLSRPNTRC